MNFFNILEEKKYSDEIPKHRGKKRKKRVVFLYTKISKLFLKKKKLEEKIIDLEAKRKKIEQRIALSTGDIKIKRQIELRDLLIELDPLKKELEEINNELKKYPSSKVAQIVSKLNQNIEIDNLVGSKTEQQIKDMKDRLTISDNAVRQKQNKEKRENFLQNQNPISFSLDKILNLIREIIKKEYNIEVQKQYFKFILSPTRINLLLNKIIKLEKVTPNNESFDYKEKINEIYKLFIKYIEVIKEILNYQKEDIISKAKAYNILENYFIDDFETSIIKHIDGYEKGDLFKKAKEAWEPVVSSIKKRAILIKKNKN